MGYTTWFDGALDFNKPVTDELKEYINKFSETRRMRRDNEKIKEIFPDWEKQCYKGNLGTDGEYFIGGTGFAGQDHDDSIIDYNNSYPAPGRWCDWKINDNGQLEWNESEKFYDYVEWLEYLIENFFKPEGYILNGSIKYNGEDDCDFGVITVKNNEVTCEEGIRVQSLKEIETSKLIDELLDRGYSIKKGN